MDDKPGSGNGRKPAGSAAARRGRERHSGQQAGDNGRPARDSGEPAGDHGRPARDHAQPAGIDLPVFGHVPYKSLGFLAGLGLAGAVGVIEWPVAAAVGAAYALARR